jgi:hypothetical protein
MKMRLLGIAITLALVVAVFATARVPAAGQSAAPAGAPALARTVDGQPMIQGVWQPRPGGSYSIEDTRMNPLGGAPMTPELEERLRTGKKTSRIIDPPDGEIPYLPWAEAQAKIYYDAHMDPPPTLLDPVGRCIVQSVPRAMYQGEYEIFQPPGYVVFLPAKVHQYRIVPLNDDRPPLGKDIQLYMGDSRGRWEGNTLVINSSNFTNKTWFDIVGSFHTDEARFEERFTVVDANRIDYRVTVHDPKAFSRPWTIATTLARVTENGYEIIEEACHEGERWSSEELLGPAK